MRPVTLSLLLAVSLTRTAAAHRLDEYLQATLIGVTRDSVNVEINLTPGVAVLPAVLAAIDRNADGQISPEEEQAYAAEVERDVELQVDGKPVSLQLVSSRFPSLQSMREGLGTIRLNMRADHSGHELRFENGHMRQVSVYLVNCLTSPDDSLLAGRPERDQAQSWIRIAYSFTDISRQRRGIEWPPQAIFWMTAMGILALGRLALRRVLPGRANAGIL